MVIQRTSLDLRNLDLSLDPSDRALGFSLSSAPYHDNPEIQNYSYRSTIIMAPRISLSYRSAISGRSERDKPLPEINAPVLLTAAIGKSLRKK